MPRETSCATHSSGLAHAEAGTESRGYASASKCVDRSSSGSGSRIVEVDTASDISTFCWIEYCDHHADTHSIKVIRINFDVGIDCSDQGHLNLRSVGNDAKDEG